MKRVTLFWHKVLKTKEVNKTIDLSNSSEKSFFSENSIKNDKDEVLKLRFEDTISRCGVSKREFLERSGLSAAYFWRLSWGIDSIPVWLKTKLCVEFGKPFVDFFLINSGEDQE